MKKIMFVIPSLGGGGAERVLLTILRHLDRATFKPFIVCFSWENDYVSELPSDISVLCLDKKNRFDALRLIASLAKIIRREQPLLLCSFLPYAYFISIVAKKCPAKECRWCYASKTIYPLIYNMNDSAV